MPRKTKLNLSPDLKLPIKMVTETFGFMAKRGAGKTYCAQKLAEEMLLANAQIIALDPIGNWWALRLNADGKSKGFAIPIFGGLHADFPLVPAAGALVADIVIDTGTSVVLDVSQFRKAEQRRFVADFCERIFSRRAAEPAATHIFFEECQSFAPQRFSQGDARMVGAVEDIVRKGRNHGFGATMISQRPQSVNKEILNQVECLFMMRVIGKHERKAIEDWIDYHDLDIADVVAELPGLANGEAWVSSPTFLKHLLRVQIDKKRTFDASKAPTVGAKGRAKKIAKLDKAKLEKAMASIVEDQKANDPRDLKKQISLLERQLRQKNPGADPAEVKQLRADLSDTRAQLTAVATQRAELQRGLSRVQKALSDSQKALESVVGELEASPKSPAKTASRPRATQASPRVRDSEPARSPRPASSNGSDLGGGALWRLLCVLVQHPDGIAKKKAAMLAKIPVKSSTLRGVLADLRKAGLEAKEGDTLKPTQQAIDEYGHKVDPLPEGSELREFYLGEVGRDSATGRLLKAAFEAWPNELTKADAAETAEIPIQSSTLRGSLAALRKLEVINKAPNSIKASDHLFD